MPDTPRPDRQPSPRRLFAVAVAAAVFGFVLTLSFGFADHAPAPHGVRVAVAAPAASRRSWRPGWHRRHRAVSPWWPRRPHPQ